MIIKETKLQLNNGFLTTGVIWILVSSCRVHGVVVAIHWILRQRDCSITILFSLCPQPTTTPPTCDDVNVYNIGQIFHIPLIWSRNRTINYILFLVPILLLSHQSINPPINQSHTRHTRPHIIHTPVAIHTKRDPGAGWLLFTVSLDHYRYRE